jgi:hypothetical protein
MEILKILSYVGIFRILLYSIGDPSSNEFNPKAIFASYSVFIAKIRAWQINIILPSFYFDSAMKFQKLENKYITNTSIINAVNPYAGWLQFLGFCSTCTSVWFFGAIYLPNFDLSSFGLSLLLSRIVFKYF